MRMMFLGLAFVTMVLGIAPAEAQQTTRPWCLRTGGEGPTGGLNDCSYYTLEQCRGAIGGGNDHCFANPDLGWDQREGRRTVTPLRR